MTLLGEFVEKEDCVLYKTSIAEGDLYQLQKDDSWSDTSVEVIEAAEEKYGREFFLESGKEVGDQGDFELFLCPC